MVTLTRTIPTLTLALNMAVAVAPIIIGDDLALITADIGGVDAVFVVGQDVM
jgi:hypothetical protein